MSLKVLVVAAHPDDEVIGMGGTIARHVRDGDEVTTLFLADGVSSREQGAGSVMLGERNHAAVQASRVLGTQPPMLLGLPDNRLDALALLDIVKPLEKVIESNRPEIIYTHHAGDLNIDHQLTHRAVVTACRPQSTANLTLLAFEVLSSTEWQTPSPATAFIPNWFVDISATMTQKLAALDCYQVEMRPPPHSRSLDNVVNLSRLRGNQVYREHAEAFMLIRHIR